jgi:glycosyltransferase involved in cell wall biosynthesis
MFPAFSRDFEKELIALLQANEFDIIQMEGLHICLYIPIIRKYSKAKIALRAHNLEYVIWERLAETERNPIKRFYLDILAKRLVNFEIKAVKAVDFIVPMTEVDAETFREMAEETSLFVSPIGLDLADYVIDKSKKEWPGIFHLGALNWMPNVQAIEWFLKEIWPKLHEQYPKLRFYIAGRDMPAWLSKLSAVGVVAVGEVDSAIDFMNSKSIMVVPLLSGSGMRVKIIEGMALGKTIVSTAIGGEGIDYENDKNIIIADEPQDFINAIKKCLNNPEFAARLGKNARQLAEKEYDNLALVKKLVGFYVQELLIGKTNSQPL